MLFGLYLIARNTLGAFASWGGDHGMGPPSRHTVSKSRPRNTADNITGGADAGGADEPPPRDFRGARFDNLRGNRTVAR